MLLVLSEPEISVCCEMRRILERKGGIFACDGGELGRQGYHKARILIGPKSSVGKRR